tara:strand:+ start:1685 stop:2329 length:645 start_codon:yes stop_codon:yes gene_type:complete
MIIFVPIKKVSQRVPNKNFRLLNNIPLYKHCLYKLKDFKVYVDTDSQEVIDEISNDKKLNNVKAYMRRKDLCGHKTSVCDLIECLITKNNIKDQTICQVHVTSPFLKPKTILNAFHYMKEGHDSIVACNLYQNRLWRKEAYGYCPLNHNPCRLEQTQDLPVFYEENSLFYIFNSNEFLKTNLRIGTKPYFYPCTFPENIDIDIESDWDIVKLLA